MNERKHSGHFFLFFVELAAVFAAMSLRCHLYVVPSLQAEIEQQKNLPKSQIREFTGQYLFIKDRIIIFLALAQMPGTLEQAQRAPRLRISSNSRKELAAHASSTGAIREVLEIAYAWQDKPEAGKEIPAA